MGVCMCVRAHACGHPPPPTGPSVGSRSRGSVAASRPANPSHRQVMIVKRGWARGAGVGEMDAIREEEEEVVVVDGGTEHEEHGPDV